MRLTLSRQSGELRIALDHHRCRGCTVLQLDLQLNLDEARAHALAAAQRSRRARGAQRHGDVVVELAGVEQRLLDERRPTVQDRDRVGWDVQAQVAEELEHADRWPLTRRLALHTANT